MAQEVLTLDALDVWASSVETASCEPDRRTLKGRRRTLKAAALALSLAEEVVSQVMALVLVPAPVWASSVAALALSLAEEVVSEAIALALVPATVWASSVLLWRGPASKHRQHLLVSSPVASLLGAA